MLIWHRRVPDGKAICPRLARPILVVCIALLSTYTAGAVGKFVSGASGTLFSGSKTRTLPSATTFTSNWTAVSQPVPSCSEWAVVTTIFAPSEAVKGVCKRPSMCCVIVGDKKTPSGYTVPAGVGSQVIVLEADQQASWFPAFGKLLPWNHFGRKNLGYLYAVAHGAKVIWDFEDDNILEGAGYEPYIQAESLKTRKLLCGKHPNPYMAFNYTVFGELWPRGYPLSQIKADRNCTAELVDLPMERVGVVQSLANLDPDVDAIYRLTGPLPIHFGAGTSVVIPADSYAPYNAQATLHFSSAFWGMLLPITVHGRVADIYRGYITQRLMRLVQLQVVFVAPAVKQQRNSHSHMHDFNSELDLYTRIDALLEFLDAWSPPPGSTSLGPALIDLYTQLYEREYIEEADVRLVEAWVSALEFYKAMPQISQSTPVAATPTCNCTTAPPVHGIGLVGDQVNIHYAVSADECARLCCRHPRCVSWMLHNFHFCHLSGPKAVRKLASNETVSGVVARPSPLYCTDCAKPAAEKLLLVVNFHWEFSLATADALLRKVFAACFLPDMDVTFVSAHNSKQGLGTLLNPFSYEGFYSYYSLSVAHAAFPSYKGYILTNDDVVHHFQNWGSVNWSRPWIATQVGWDQEFVHHKPLVEKLQCPPSWDWLWFRNVRGQPQTRGKSNHTFCDASVASVHDYNAQVQPATKASVYSYCKADAYYIPGAWMPLYNTFTAISLHHQSFLEIAVPTFIQQFASGVPYRFCGPNPNPTPDPTPCFVTHPLKISRGDQLNQLDVLTAQCKQNASAAHSGMALIPLGSMAYYNQ